MGHKTYKPKYGHGPSLELKLEFLERIMFKPPGRLSSNKSRRARSLVLSFCLRPCNSGLEFLVHREMHVAVELDEIS